MYKPRLRKYIIQMKKNPGVSLSSLQNVQEELGFKFPVEYADFLLESNGAEGPIGNAYLVLWALEKIKSWNQMYEVDKYAPHLILFGSDGGDMGFAFDKRFELPPIVEIAYMDLGLEEPKTRGRTFLEFME